jgi:hypothetical protein
MRQKRSNSFPEFRRHERGIRDELDVETRAIGTISLLELLSAFGEATKWRKWGKVAEVGKSGGKEADSGCSSGRQLPGLSGEALFIEVILILSV